MIKFYLQLVRFPGIFTAFSNIFVGFSLAFSNSLDWSNLPFLLSSSGFLFMAGMTLNDFFDYEIDKKERPNRPLPSKIISKKKALFLGILFLILANISAGIASLESLGFSFLLSLLIISYDFKSKNIRFLGILNLSAIRFFNVILGMSIVTIHFDMLLFAIPIAIFVAGISILAKYETFENTQKYEKINFSFIIIAIIFTLILILEKYNPLSIIFLVVFSISVILPFLKKFNSMNVQKKISFQLLSIILLDTTLVVHNYDFWLGILVALMYIPSFLIAKKLYVT